MKGNGFVFGAYTHCQWPAADSTVADLSGKSFLFSLVNETGKAVRFSLRDKDRAIEVHDDGIFFGATKVEGGMQTGWPNVVLMRFGSADDIDSNASNDLEVGNTSYSQTTARCATRLFSPTVLCRGGERSLPAVTGRASVQRSAARLIEARVRKSEGWSATLADVAVLSPLMSLICAGADCCARCVGILFLFHLILFLNIELAIPSPCIRVHQPPHPKPAGQRISSAVG